MIGDPHDDSNAIRQADLRAGQHTKFVRWVLLASVLVLVAPAKAALTIADTFVSPGSQFAASGNGIPATYEQANAFVVTADDFITGIDIALSQVAPPSGLVTLHIRGSAGAFPSTSSLFTSGDISALLTSSAAVVHVLVGSLAVTAGSTYWLSVDVGAGASMVTWRDALGGIGASEPYRQNSGAWVSNSGTVGAFRILGAQAAAVPEPGILLLLGLGAGGMGALRWRQRCARG